MLQYFERQVGLSWNKNLKVSFFILSWSDSKSRLFYDVLPEKFANDGLSVKIVDVPGISHNSYKFLFRLDNRNLVLNYLEIETNTSLPLLDEILSRNEIIRRLFIAEKSTSFDAKPKIVKYICKKFPECVDQIEKYVLSLPAESNCLPVDRIDALISLKDLEIIWDPKTETRIEQPPIKQIAQMLKNKTKLEILDLNFQQSHDLDNLHQLLQELFNLPRFTKFSLTVNFGTSKKKSTSSKISNCLDLEGKLEISGTKVTFEKPQSLASEASLLHGSNRRYDYIVKIVCEKK